VGLYLLVAYAVLGMATLTSSHEWGDDWAQYVLHARNIVTGIPYGDTGYIFNPDAPYVGPPEYPPGLPLLLAPVVAMSGLDIVALKAVCFLCFIGMLPIAYRVLARPFGRKAAFTAVVLFALHEQVWTLRQYIGSEEPYMLLSMLTLWYASRDRPDSAGTRTVAAGVVVGVLAFASVACRSIGVALLPALLLDAWARRQPLAWQAAFLASFALLIALQKSLLVAPATYSNELTVPGMQLILDNLKGYWAVTLWVIPMPSGFPSDIALAAFIAVAMSGAWRAFGSAAAGGSGLPFRARIACVPLPVWYLLAYLSALALASISPGPRFLFPILPIALVLAAAGGGHLASRMSRPRPYAFALASFIAVYYVYLHASAREWRDDELATCGACREMYAFVQAHTPPGSVIAFAKPRAIALLGQRPGWMWNPDYDADVFRAKLQRARASFLITVAPGTYLYPRYPAYLDGKFQEEIGTTVFRNAMFRVIELGDRR
jgi:hypothetical protein